MITGACTAAGQESTEFRTRCLADEHDRQDRRLAMHRRAAHARAPSAPDRSGLMLAYGLQGGGHPIMIQPGRPRRPTRSVD